MPTAYIDDDKLIAAIKQAFGEGSVRLLFDVDGKVMPTNVARCFAAAVIESAHSDLLTICAEAYQVVGALADEAGRFDDAAVIKTLDNLSQQRLVHSDVLPFPSKAGGQQ